MKNLMEDGEVGNKKGIYEYVFDKDEKHLNLRQFSPKQKRETYEKQKGICPLCVEDNKTKEWKIEHHDKRLYSVKKNF